MVVFECVFLVTLVVIVCFALVALAGVMAGFVFVPFKPVDDVPSFCI